MVRVETHLGAAGTLPALDPQLEGLVAADAELVFALKTVYNKREIFSVEKVKSFTS
jgi:hypothetical protein